VYRPIIERAIAAGLFPLTLHVSGPLLEWLEQHDTAWLDMIGRLAATNASSCCSPDSTSRSSRPCPPRPPRADQPDARIPEARFGVQATGLWLTERVWQPELAADLAEAGVEYALVDDRHFLVSGFRHDELHRPHHTESDGRRVGLLAIDERLRYLIPFRPPEETASYLRELRSQGHGLACWPMMREVRRLAGDERVGVRLRLLDTFLRTMEQLTAAGEIKLSTARKPSGGSVRRPRLSRHGVLPRNGDLGAASNAQRDLARWRRNSDPSIWRLQHRSCAGTLASFLVKYPESNRMHKTMTGAVALSRSRGDPPEARRAIGRPSATTPTGTACSRPLSPAPAERALAPARHRGARAAPGESLAYESWISITTATRSCGSTPRSLRVISPQRGGAIEMLTDSRTSRTSPTF